LVVFKIRFFGGEKKKERKKEKGEASEMVGRGVIMRLE